MPPRSWSVRSFVGEQSRPAASLYAVVKCDWACAATPSAEWVVPLTTIPGGNPVIAVPGLTPRSPFTTVGPVLVTVVPASTAKLAVVPRPTGASAARDVELIATRKIDRMASAKIAVIFRAAGCGMRRFADRWLIISCLALPSRVTEASPRPKRCFTVRLRQSNAQAVREPRRAPRCGRRASEERRRYPRRTGQPRAAWC